MSKLFGAKEKPSIGVSVKDLQGAVCSGFLYKRGPKPTASYVRKFVVIHSGRVFYFNSPEVRSWSAGFFFVLSAWSTTYDGQHLLQPNTPARGFLELGKFRLGAILTGTTHDIPILTVRTLLAQKSCRAVANLLSVWAGSGPFAIRQGVPLQSRNWSRAWVMDSSVAAIFV
jgi:hypothetical protein